MSFVNKQSSFFFTEWKRQLTTPFQRFGLFSTNRINLNGNWARRKLASLAMVTNCLRRRKKRVRKQKEQNKKKRKDDGRDVGMEEEWEGKGGGEGGGRKRGRK